MENMPITGKYIVLISVEITADKFSPTDGSYGHGARVTVFGGLYKNSNRTSF